jgi:hypothetical protein
MSDDIESILEAVRNRPDRDEFPEGSYGRFICDVVHGGFLMKKSKKEILYVLSPLFEHIAEEDAEEMKRKGIPIDDQKNPRDD